MKAARAYARASGETASKERLMVMLFETALKHMRHAAPLMEQKKSLEAGALLTKALDIVSELAATLDTERAPELAESLGVLYLFVAERLANGIATKDPKWVHEAERAFAPVVEGFQQAVASLGEQGVQP